MSVVIFRLSANWLEDDALIYETSAEMRCLEAYIHKVLSYKEFSCEGGGSTDKVGELLLPVFTFPSLCNWILSIRSFGNLGFQFPCTSIQLNHSVDFREVDLFPTQ